MAILMVTAGAVALLFAVDAVRRLFSPINGGNDLGGMFLTEVQARAAREGLSNKGDWP